MRPFCYTILTSMIILIGKLRDHIFHHEMRVFRFDRTLPWPKYQSPDGLYVGCCDCGLEHIFFRGLSGTPVRPEQYSYLGRFGAMGHTGPPSGLGERAHEIFIPWWDSYLAQINKEATPTGAEEE